MHQKFRVMVIEDESMIRKNIIKKINQSQLLYEVVDEAQNGEEALGLIEKSLPHLVVTDIRMPVMDGLELIKNIYFAYPSVKVMIISGYNDFEYAKTGIQYGVKDFLLKPVNMDELKETLMRIEFELISERDERLQSMVMPSRQLTSEQVADYAEHYIKGHYHSNLSVTDVADRLGYSSDYIGKVFKKHKGATLIKFITKLRIQEAKQLLLDHPELEIQEIGSMVGYSDPFYFSRVFKKITNQYPSELR